MHRCTPKCVSMYRSIDDSCGSDPPDPPETHQSPDPPETHTCNCWLRTNGVNTNGGRCKSNDCCPTGKNVCLGTFWKIKLTRVPKSLSNKYKIGSDPVSVDPIGPFPKLAPGRWMARSSKGDPQVSMRHRSAPKEKCP